MAYVFSGKGNKSKDRKMGLHQIKKLLPSKKKAKKTIYQMGEDICKQFDKVFISKLYKELIQLNKRNNSIKNWAKERKYIFPKRTLK